MSVIQKYIDWIGSTKIVLENYNNMQAIIDHTDEQIKDAYERMENYRTTAVDDAFGLHSMQASENHILRMMDEVDFIKKRYADACAFMAWFRPAWEALSDSDQFILKAFYMDVPQDDAMATVDTIEEKYGLSRTAAYKRKDRAVERLSVLLFGEP